MKPTSPFRPTGRTLRALLAVGLVGILLVSLLLVRERLDEEEKRATYVMSSLSWKVSEALLESQKMVTALGLYEQGGADREDVIVAAELLWSRTDVLLQSEFNKHVTLVEAGQALQAYLSRNEEQIYDAAEFPVHMAAAMREELSEAARDMRAIWIRDFLGNRATIHATATQDIADARAFFERLIMACVALLALYMIAEIRGAQRAQVREHKLRKEALSASEAKSDFLANVSHEIRTPLNGVIGMAQELAETQQTEDQRQMTQVIASSAELLLGTINDVLDISKIERGRMALKDLVFAPAERVRLSAELYSPQAQAKEVRIVTKVPPGAGAELVADPLRFTQVVNNLVSNAVKFTDSGEVTVSLAFAERKGGLCEVEVAVSDTGPGVPEGALDQIFRPFSQADTSATRQHGGTGLGLTISRAICKEMGGDISVDSEPGRGSVFTARFMMRAPRDGDPRATLGAASLPPKPKAAPTKHANLQDQKPGTLSKDKAPKGPNILLVDDSATNRLVMKRLLKSLDARIEEAESGLDAVRLAETGGFDLILMDIQMPGMDGMEATTEIRAKEARGETAGRVPIIAVTANVMSHQVETYRALGMDEVVAKPVRKAEILDAIGQLSGQAGKRQDMRPH